MTETGTATIAQRITAAYNGLAAQAGDLVSLARLRAALADLDQAEVTRELKALDRARVLQLDPDPNRKALDEAAVAAAVVIGGEPKHLVSM